MVKPDKIHSLKDLEMEKQRLKLEILKAENHIQTDYHNLLHSFTLKNIASNMFQDISATSSVVSKAFTIGKSLFSRKKKKKQREDTDEI
jgi:hypothetical protein